VNDVSDQPSSPVGPDLAAGIPATSLQQDVPLLGHVGREPVILVRRGSDVFAVGATCTHYGGPLAEGLVVDDTVRCPWHHACFDLRTGAALRAPALNPLTSYDVVRREESIVVVGPREPRGAARPRARRADTPPSVAIVGAGAAGNSAAEELRHLGFEGTVTLFDGDESAPYDRPNLSKDYLAGTAPEEWLPLHPRSYYKELAVELVLGRRVTGLDAGAKRLTIDDGTMRQFGAVVLATGADPVRLTIPGTDGPPIYYLRSLADSRRIIRATEGARRAVVLGAGFIGLEVAASLRTRGLDVHVVAPGPRPLQRVLGPELGDFIKALHEEHGVVFHLGQTARGLEPRRVVLQNGERLEADLVVAGVGVSPAVALAERAGLAVDHGIVVDRYLETSGKGVFAIGDVARWPDPRSGSRVRIEHWVLAQRQGQAVARSIAGDRTPFADVPFFWSQHYDVSINYVGHADRWDAIEIDGSLQRRDCSVRYRAGGRLLAMASLSRDRESLETELAMERAVAP
jgi:NADPH-dependent 2,4-dienoyl-CoA reductase/sulfur reductase-like enzyme/nitrite reductase/ring-hydroxylating ferredoxin subunit